MTDDPIPPPTAREWEERLAKVRADLLRPMPRLWPDGTRSKCPNCGVRSFQGRSDLSAEVPSRGHVIAFRHLQGGRCGKCAYTLLEPGDQFAIEQEAGTVFHADYEAKVSRIGSGTLGTYWPKDVSRVMHLRPHDIARIQVIAPDTAVVKFERPGAKRE